MHIFEKGINKIKILKKNCQINTDNQPIADMRQKKFINYLVDKEQPFTFALPFKE